MKIPTSLLAIFMAVMVFPAAAIAQIKPETRWADPDQVALTIEFPGEGYNADWQMFRCNCGDLLVESQLSVPGETVIGDLVLIEGRAVLSRGFGKFEDEAAASLDAAALMMQLALRLLERSEPAGPSGITDRRDIDVEDKLNHINLDTGTAVGGFRAPWSIAGTITPAGETKRRFDLIFSFAVGEPGAVQETSMRLRGVADFAELEYPLSRSESLEGWNLDWRDPADPAAGVEADATTVDQLRALLRENP